MLDPSRFAPAAAPVAEIERRLRWRALPVLAFLAILISLAVIAVMPILRPPRLLSGLPSDPDVGAAAALLRGRLRLDAGGLRYQSALIGDNREGQPYGTAIEPEVKQARGLLARARVRFPDDARIAAAAASLALSCRDLERAERGFRAALDREPDYGEARLGLGVTLAIKAAASSARSEARRLRLEAIAQFASVDERDPALEAALYDRALLLGRVGRRDEARGLARAYLARDPSSPWAEALRVELGTPGR